MIRITFQTRNDRMAFTAVCARTVWMRTGHTSMFLFTADCLTQNIKNKIGWRYSYLFCEQKVYAPLGERFSGIYWYWFGLLLHRERQDFISESVSVIDS